jgi:hypothetical protein
MPKNLQTPILNLIKSAQYFPNKDGEITHLVFLDNNRIDFSSLVRTLLPESLVQQNRFKQLIDFVIHGLVQDHPFDLLAFFEDLLEGRGWLLGLRV